MPKEIVTCSFCGKDSHWDNELNIYKCTDCGKITGELIWDRGEFRRQE